MASLMSSTQSTTGGFNQAIRTQSAFKSAGVRNSITYLDNRNNNATADKNTASDQNWVEVYDMRSNTVGYVLK